MGSRPTFEFRQQQRTTTTTTTSGPLYSDAGPASSCRSEGFGAGSSGRNVEKIVADRVFQVASKHDLDAATIARIRNNVKASILDYLESVVSGDPRELID